MHSAFSALLSGLLALAATPSAHAAGAFEGTIHTNGSTEHGPMEMTYVVKGGLTRIDLSNEAGQQFIVVTDREKALTDIIVPARKVVIEQPMQSTQAPAPAGEEQWTKSGKSETILGYTAEEWTGANAAGEETHAWVTRELGAYLPFSNPMARHQAQAWETWANEEGYFPLRVVRTKGDKEISRFDVTGIERKAPDDAAFAIPAEYRKMAFPAMHGGVPRTDAKPVGN